MLDDKNLDKFKPIVDCLGTCKTPIGCTCGKKEAREAREKEAGEVAKIVMDGSVKTESVSFLKVAIDTKICTCGKNPGGLCGCKTGEGCGCSTGKGADACRGCTKKSAHYGTHKLEVYDWLNDMPESYESFQMVEVQFKNTRKGYYLNSNDIELYKGDIVAVEATPGHDIGEVTLTGKLVPLQMKKNNYRTLNGEHKRVYRIAKPTDIEKSEAAKKKEHATMLEAREIAEDLGLAMKISDVEYQGDGNKAIFYYIADERVDFRQLIKVYAERFRVKIEMKQIGARQEAGRVGGIGSCGRQLCCSGSISSFVSVSTAAARYQDISLNPQKLAGQCGKLKCCLNYEVDTYLEAQRKLPSRETVLETKDAAFFHFKTDVLSGMMTYSSDKRMAANLITVDKDRVFDVIRMNKHGKKPFKLDEHKEAPAEKESEYKDILEESITRFDSSGGNRNNRNNNKKKKVVKTGAGGPQEQQPKAEARAQNNQSNNAQPKDGNAPAVQQEGGQNRDRRNNRPRNNNNNNNNRRPKQQGQGPRREKPNEDSN